MRSTTRWRRSTTFVVPTHRAYRALVMLVLAAYYRSPDVQARIGWPGPVGTAVGRFDYPEYLSEGLLDHVMAKERHA